MPSPATYFTRPSNIRPAALSSIESLELGALQGLLWLKSGEGAPMNENMSLVNNCSNVTATTTYATTTEVTIDESTLTLHPKKKKKKINHKSTAAPEKKIRRTITPENLPSVNDDNDAPTTLHSEEDKDYINPIHTIIRKDIIEVFVDKSDKATAGVVRSSFSSRFILIIARCTYMHHHNVGSCCTVLYQYCKVHLIMVQLTIHISSSHTYIFHAHFIISQIYIFLFYKTCNNLIDQEERPQGYESKRRSDWFTL